MLLLLFLLCVRWSTHAADPPEHSGVLLLSHGSFDAAARAFQPLFVLVDAPARKGSLELFRAFADAAVTLRASQRESAPRMRFAFLDVLAASDVPDRLGVKGLPELVRLRCSPKVGNLVAGANATTTTSSAGCSLDDAEVESYTGGRTSAEFQRFMLDQPQREVLVLYDRPALEALVAAQPFVALVAVDGRDTQPYFDAIALAQTDAGASVFAVSANPALLESDAERAQIPSLVVYRDFGAARVVFTGLWRKSALLSFVVANKYGAVSTYSARFPSFLYDATAAAHVLLFSDEQFAGHAALLAQLHELALPYASPLLSNAPVRFVHVPASETALRSSLFVRTRHVPALLVVKDVGAPATRFPVFGRELLAAVESTRFKDEFGALLAESFPLVFRTAVLDEDENGDEDSGGAFGSVLLDTVEPPGSQRELRSAAAESESDALSPWELRRQQRSLVRSASSARWVREQQRARDVVVSFWSPRCYGCRAFADVFEQAARHPGGGGDVLFARLNVDAVDVAPLALALTRLPSVFVFPRGAAAPVAFAPRRFTLAELLAFVAQSCPTVSSSSVDTTMMTRT